jgi:predicted nucleic acid-binding protein
VKGIVDTGFLVAIRSPRDHYHEWAKGVEESITEPLLVCEAVLAETAYHLGGARHALSFLEAGMVRLAFEMGEHLGRLQELAEKYRDRSPDLADLCVIRMSEMYPKHVVVTTDVADFRVYRRGRREAIPLVHP